MKKYLSLVSAAAVAVALSFMAQPSDSFAAPRDAPAMGQHQPGHPAPGQMAQPPRSSMDRMAKDRPAPRPGMEKKAPRRNGEKHFGRGDKKGPRPDMNRKNRPPRDRKAPRP